ncbi:hypothetical protein [Croceicoccus sp. YJ47]|uniref:hypothetical protein n=1 Tax=Croceicoccus sp. YJ47 TaxID=2798724 RepID=UPI0019233E60|nr:hypothetical protein [Croceicoccus sp. YJ47]QQN74303.1 hypothetical protein JD971_00345 [Croceicoccus sp. YJ47]
MTDGAPQIHHLAVDADVNLVELPWPLAKTAYSIQPLTANICREHQTSKPHPFREKISRPRSGSRPSMQQRSKTPRKE